MQLYLFWIWQAIFLLKWQNTHFLDLVAVTFLLVGFFYPWHVGASKLEGIAITAWVHEWDVKPPKITARRSSLKKTKQSLLLFLFLVSCSGFCYLQLLPWVKRRKERWHWSGHILIPYETQWDTLICPNEWKQIYLYAENN